MTATYTLKPLVLGVFPTSRGLGWVVFDGPFSVVAHGVYTVFNNRNVACLRKVEQLLGTYQPETVVLEAFEAPAPRADRVRRLCRSIAALVPDHGHGLSIFPRSQVQAAFARSGALTREEVARDVARQVPALEHRLPKPRRFGDGESKAMGLFNAAALVLTHYYFSSQDLLDDLGEAA